MGKCTVGSVYTYGQSVDVEATFKDGDGVLTDPSSVVFKVITPDGQTTSYTVGSDPEATKVSTGVYRLRIEVNQEGIWYYRAEGLGTIKGAGEGSFVVEDSKFY